MSPRTEDAEVLDTSLAVLRAEERIERLARELVEARSELKWAQINQRVATLALRRSRKRAP